MKIRSSIEVKLFGLHTVNPSFIPGNSLSTA